MEITTFKQLVKYIDNLKIKGISIRFTQIALKANTFRMMCSTPSIIYENYFTRYTSTKGKVLFMCGDEYYNEKEIVEHMIRHLDEIIASREAK